MQGVNQINGILNYIAGMLPGSLNIHKRSYNFNLNSQTVILPLFMSYVMRYQSRLDKMDLLVSDDFCARD